FPEASFHYALQMHHGKSSEEALAGARSKWLGSDAWPGEFSNPYTALCFCSADPLDEEFMAFSEAVFTPMLEHWREVKA
ncbi:MAG: hypothetical protein PHP23_15740, partial [Desulfobacterales bacterium]|nr:hypothetical protein [Desulfobacterales bacterium]